MKNSILFNKENLFILFLFFFSLLINQYYGNKGIFPADSFAHFDTGSRILLGEHPFKNFWIVSGPFIDYVQAIFFYFFGVNWQSYVFHASLINGILSVATFLVLRNFQLNIYYSFFYSLAFSILAYPSSGTPFVDHHSAFFSLFGVYSFLLALNNKSKIQWFLIPFFLGLAFLSKQVPASYIILSVGFILMLYSFRKRTFIYINYCLISSIVFILFVLLFGGLKGIKLSDFFDQYIFYPQTIGLDRLENFNFTFSGVVDHFKFIYFMFIPLLYVNYKKILDSKNYFKNNEIFVLLILFSLTFSLIFHQLLTSNQTFIFFLVPILAAFSHIALNEIKIKFVNLTQIILILVCLFAATKYHLRFNENRKFHELTGVNLTQALEANLIDKKLEGLNWITRQYSEQPRTEINIINQIKLNLKHDSRKKMLITNYTFFSSILDQ